MTTVTLITRDGCHLCEVARGVLDYVLAELPEQRADAIEIQEARVEDDAALERLWGEKVPVVLIDGRMHAHWRVDGVRLRDALMADAGVAS